MSVALAISVACLVLGMVLAAKWRLGPARSGPTLPSRGAAASPPDASAPRASDRCLLCNRPLRSQFVTREEVVARVEQLIDSDNAAVANLLSSPLPADWAGPSRP